MHFRGLECLLSFFPFFYEHANIKNRQRARESNAPRDAFSNSCWRQLPRGTRHPWSRKSSASYLRSICDPDRVIFFFHDKIPSYNVSLTRKRAHFTSRLKVFCEDLKINKRWQAFRKSIDPVAFSPRRKFIEQDAYRQEAIYLRSIVKWYQLETIVIIVYYRNYYFSKLHRSRFLRKEGGVESAATSEIWQSRCRLREKKALVRFALRQTNLNVVNIHGLLAAGRHGFISSNRDANFRCARLVGDLMLAWGKVRWGEVSRNARR